MIFITLAQYRTDMGGAESSHLLHDSRLDRRICV